MWTEEAIKAVLDGTFTKISYTGEVRTHRTPSPDFIPEARIKKPQARGFKHKRERRYWTKEEDLRLIDLRACGLPHCEIAETLGRTYDAIHNRLYKLLEV